MIIIEYDKSKESKFDLKKLKSHLKNGTIKLQSKHGRFRICEVIRSGKNQYHGSLEFQENEPLHFYKYTLYADKTFFKFFYSYRLPNTLFEKTFDTLFFDGTFKMAPLIYLYKIREFRKRGVSLNIFDLNKTLLFYGPPGTGKTSMGRAVFQRISIRIRRKVLMIDINASSLFTKYYGETTSLFSQLTDELEKMSQEAHLCILIDEIETILTKRNISIHKNEPLESTRLVNAFLVMLDKFKVKKNVYFIFTSNFIENLDDAFLDRIDIKMEFKRPDYKISYTLLSDIFRKMVYKSIISYFEPKSYEVWLENGLFEFMYSGCICKMKDTLYYRQISFLTENGLLFNIENIVKSKLGMENIGCIMCLKEEIEKILKIEKFSDFKESIKEQENLNNNEQKSIQMVFPFDPNIHGLKSSVNEILQDYSTIISLMRGILMDSDVNLFLLFISFKINNLSPRRLRKLIFECLMYTSDAVDLLKLLYNKIKNE